MTRGRQNCFRLLDCRAFSLVEVVLALGVATFGLLAIVALLPMGIQSTADSLEETAAINVLSEVIADRAATPLADPSAVYQVPALTSALTIPVTKTFGVTNQNQYSSQLAQSRYRVDYTITPPAVGNLSPYQVWFKVSWPASGASPVGSVEGIGTFAQP